MGIRVHELAKELKKSNREVSDRLRKLGIEANSNLSSISPEDENRVRTSFGLDPKKIEKPAKKATKKATKKPAKKATKKATKKPAKKPAKKAGAAKPAKKPAKKKKEKSDARTAAPTPVREKQAKPETTVPGVKGKVAKAEQAPAGEPERPAAAPVERKPARKPFDRKVRVAPPDKKAVAPSRTERKVYRFVPKGRRARRPSGKPSTVARKMLRVPSGVTVKEFAQMVGLTPGDVERRMIGFGEALGINDSISDEAIRLLAEDLGLQIKIKASKTEEFEEIVDRLEDLEERPPVVTVMGHVDHGKTLLLDTIRETDVVGQEQGGITQHIGAYQVSFDGNPITFIDTPGHESFTAMRARGARITDIAVLVVAADDGAMPQTLEALDHAREAGVPVMVAVNKIDKPDSDPYRVRQQLAEHNLVPDDWGGDTVFVDVSAKEGTNIDHLLEMIILVSQMNDLKANPGVSASGVVVESELDRARGPAATFLVERGTLKIGDVVAVGIEWGKVRAMFDDRGEQVESAAPSKPVEVLGLSNPPMAGDEFRVVASEKKARQMADRRRHQKKQQALEAPRHVSLEDLFDQIKKGEATQLKVVAKADTQGSLEVVLDSVKKLSMEEVELNVIHYGVGAVSETDIMLASASDALIVCFNVRPDSKAARAAEKEGVEIRTYQVIYNLTDDIEAALTGMLEPEYEEIVTGRVEVRQTFRVPGLGLIAGSYVQEGEINRTSKVRVVRDGVVVYDGKVASLRRFKDDVKSVAAGFECGVGLEDFKDLKELDILEAYTMKEVPRG